MENTKCPICGFSNNKIVGIPVLNPISKRIVKMDHKVVQCTICKLYFVSPELTFSKNEWQQLYNSNYFIENTIWLESKRRYDLLKRLDRLFGYFKPHQEINFLDIGCGQGYGLIESYSRGWNTTGIDIFDNRIGEAKIDDINFLQGDLSELELKGSFFDIIYIDSVLEHVPKPMEYVEKIKLLLKPGGIVYIGVPNEDSFLNDIRKLSLIFRNKKNRSAKLKPFESPYHIIGFNRLSLDYMIKKSGLDRVFFHNFSRKLEFLGFRYFSHGFWMGILLLPVEFGGSLLRRDTYFEVILRR
jgi:2-polyprenyl-3-methyl-5-hydroxy-6-metoxy-1,4-benzoquinol methylase